VTTPEFVPLDFVPPAGLTTPRFTLTPLGPQHNDADYAAWTSSVDHIHATPGFADHGWPHPMSRDQNLQDLVDHARDFEQRRGFTYTVLDPGAAVIGCVYIYPLKDAALAASVRSWVTAEHAELDEPLYLAVTAWLDDAWAFDRIEYAPRQNVS
jgi:hypothetical protein